MELSYGHIRPGRVLEVVDEKGTIKACCCGLLSDQDEPSKLPPMYPLITSNTCTFTSMKKDDEIWVMSFNDNPRELLYFRKDDKKDNLKDILNKGYEDIEVVVSRETGVGYAQLYFTDGTGWIVRNDDSIVQINRDGDIILDKGSLHRSITINDEGIAIGGRSQAAVLGDKLVDCLKSLSNALESLENAAESSPYTAHLKPAIEVSRIAFTNSINYIKSKHVTLD